MDANAKIGSRKRGEGSNPSLGNLRANKKKRKGKKIRKSIVNSVS